MYDNNFGSFFRRRIVFIIIVGFFALSVTQLFNMQILEQISYSEKSDENSVKPIYQTAPRGVLFDRNHQIRKASFSR
mgnify:CR=1 FL=1